MPPILRGPLLLLFLLVPVCLTATSCGAIAYGRAWDRYEDPEDGEGMVGRWKGTWSSEWNGHSGGLKCMVTREGEEEFLARFYSTFGWFFFFRHTTTFRITEVTPTGLVFEGEEDLGEMVGGVYRYEGTVAGDRFEARFEAENGDHGVFEMERLAPPDQKP